MKKELATVFTVKDHLGERTLVVPPEEPTWVGDPTLFLLDIEARTRTRLRDGGNPVWYIRLHTDFTARSNPADNVSFAEYVKRRHPDKVEAVKATCDTPRRGRRKRTSTGPTSSADVVVRSGRRCCLCFGLQQDMREKRGQIAHLDGNKNNNSPGNLAWLCLEHHDQFDSSTSQSRNYMIREVKSYRKDLYRTIKRLAKGFDRGSGGKAENDGNDRIQGKRAEVRLGERVKLRGRCSAVLPDQGSSQEEGDICKKINDLPVERDCSWDELFWAVARAIGYGKSSVPSGNVRYALTGLLEHVVDLEIRENECYGSVNLDPDVVDVIALKLISLRLVTIRKDNKQFMGEFWSLTDKGERYYAYLASNERENLPSVRRSSNFVWE